MATSIDTAADDWAVVPVSSDPVFWEVFVRAVNSPSWRLVTPPGVADNAGLVAAAGGVSSLTVAVRPSQDLLFSPLAATADGGSRWSAAGPISAGVAASPGGLAAFGGKLAALLGNGAIEASANAGATWSTLAKPDTIAASPAGKGCGGAVQVTTISFGPTGTDVLAGGTCGTVGTTAVFSYSTGAGWQRVSLPVSGQLVRLTDEMALVLGKSGLRALWREMPAANEAVPPANAAQPAAAGWSASAALPVSGPVIASGALAGSRVPAGSEAVAGAGPQDGSGAWVLLPGGRAAMISAPAPPTPAGHAPAATRVLPRWVLLPPLPAHTTVLASGPGGATDALAVSGATLTVWQLAPGATRWAKAQTIVVPIQYGSSS
ncbi:MAG TPA: hypothetical protein VGG83_10245 [Trebonia sp.]|jgi:hypothetical protein